MIENIEGILRDFSVVVKISGIASMQEEIIHEFLPAPHKQPRLPKNNHAVYIFSVPTNNNLVLKVGKVGPKSNARFQSQHYNPKSSRSNLAKSMLNSPILFKKMGLNIPSEEEIGEWIKNNTDRNHFFISDNKKSKTITKLLEVFLETRLNPVFEG